MTKSTVLGTDLALFCRLRTGAWHRVVSQSDAGVLIDDRVLDFDAVWRGTASPPPPEARQRRVAWSALDVPLPDHGMHCWGYAFTYQEHRDETLDKQAFRFRQRGPATANSGTIPFRPHLDFELEIGLLMHRDAPDRFGYFLANDLTDRGVQVRTYDAKDPAPGFAKAKGFAGALRAGPLLAVGDASLWPRLTARLSLNGEVRQTLHAADCKLDPARFHGEAFEKEPDKPWAAVATGTSGGTLFRLPRPDERIKAFFAGGFSMKRAKEIWLGRLRFLLPGDELVLESPILGRCATRLEEEEQ